MPIQNASNILRDPPIGGGGGSSSSGLSILHTNPGPQANYSRFTPKQLPLVSGQFTPQTDKVMFFIDATHDIAEPDGSWVAWFLFVGPVGSVLTPKKQGDALAAGVTRTLLGSTMGRQAGRHFTPELTGLVPGTPLAYEITVGLVGGAAQWATGPSPSYVACSDVPAPYGTPNGSDGDRDGALIVAVKDGATPPSLHLYKAQHTLGRASDKPLATFAQPAAATTVFGKVDVTPDGTRVVICNQADGAVQIYKTGLLDGTTPVLQARVPFAATTTTVIDVVCMPDNATAWVIGGGQYFAKLDLVAGAFVAVGATTYFALGAGTGVQQIAASPDGAYVYISANTAGNVRKVRVSDGTVVATSPALPGVKPVACSVDGAFVFAASSGQNPNKVYKLNATDLTIATSVNISGTTHNAEAIDVFSDGIGFLIASSIGSTGSGLKQYDTADLSNYTNWPVHGPGTAVNQVVNDVAITPNGTIYAPSQGDGYLAMWNSGSIIYTPNDNFWDHQIKVVVAQAS